jgi:hypothetical protein
VPKRDLARVGRSIHSTGSRLKRLRVDRHRVVVKALRSRRTIHRRAPLPTRSRASEDLGITTLERLMSAHTTTHTPTSPAQPPNDYAHDDDRGDTREVFAGTLPARQCQRA